MSSSFALQKRADCRKSAVSHLKGGAYNGVNWFDGGLKMKQQYDTRFLGANTPEGFVSLFDELYDPSGDWRAYVIKGGPGTGKSGLMRSVAEQLEQAGYQAQRVLCSSDPASLDGVIFPQLRACIADGTAPHVIEPRFPGAVEELINLGVCWNAEQLRAHADGIRAASIKNSAYHQRCVGFLSAAGSLANDTLRIALECINADKIAAYASRFAAREFGTGHGRVGRESRCFLSAITPEGLVVCYDTVSCLCSRVIAVDDAYGAVSSLLLERLRSYALAAGLDVTVCLCPMSAGKRIEHLLIPSAGLCLFTANRFHPAPETPLRRIHARRFMDAELLKTHRYRLHFNAKAEMELLKEAVHMLENAKQTHDALEAFYIPAMDFKKVEKKGAQLVRELLTRGEQLGQEG